MRKSDKEIDALHTLLYSQNYDFYYTELVKFVNKHPKMVFYSILLAEQYILRKRFDLALELLSRLNLEKVKEKGYLELYYKNLAYSYIGLELYDEAYSILIDNQEIMEDANVYYGEVCVYLKEKLGIPLTKSLSDLTYFESQLLDYKLPVLFKVEKSVNDERVKNYDNDKEEDVDRAYYYDENVISIDKLLTKVIETLPNENAIPFNGIYDLYYYSYPNCSCINDKRNDTFRVIAVKNTNRIKKTNPIIPPKYAKVISLEQ